MIVKILLALWIILFLKGIRNGPNWRYSNDWFWPISLLTGLTVLAFCMGTTQGEREWSQTKPYTTSGWYECGEGYALSVVWSQPAKGSEIITENYYSNKIPEKTIYWVGRGYNMFGLQTFDETKVDFSK